VGAVATEVISADTPPAPALGRCQITAEDAVAPGVKIVANDAVTVVP
jgi:hypothetical protein